MLVQGFLQVFLQWFLHDLYKVFDKVVYKVFYKVFTKCLKGSAYSVFAMCSKGFLQGVCKVFRNIVYKVSTRLWQGFCRVLTRLLQHVHRAFAFFHKVFRVFFTNDLQCVYKAFRMFLEGVWWLPTVSGVRTSQKEFMDWERARRIKMEEGAYKMSSPRQRFSRRKPLVRRFFFGWLQDKISYRPIS